LLELLNKKKMKEENSVNSLGTDAESNICESSNISKTQPPKILLHSE
jgi:hypothetical protein